MRLAPASLATTISPDTATFTSASPFTVVLPLSSQLTGREMDGNGGTIRVYRHDRDIQGQRNLPHREPLVGRIVEVASTAASRPDFVSAATIDSTAGTIRFTTTRFGTFQSFVEVARTFVPLLRETFDDVRAPDGISRPLPEGWRAGNSWEAGPVFVHGTTLPTPLPASPPNVLATNLRGGLYRASADDRVTSRTIVKGAAAVPGGHQLRVRYREWIRLNAGDSVSLDIILPDQSVVNVPGATHAGVFTTTGTSFTDVGPLDITALVGVAESFSLRFRIVSNNDGLADRGWYVDDLTVAIEPQ
jgi:hypothetical protein